MRRFGAVVAVVVLDEVDLVGRHEHDVRDDAERTGLAHDQVGAVVVRADGRQTTAGRGVSQPSEVVAGVRERVVGADRELPGVEMEVVAEPEYAGRRRAGHVHLAVAALHYVHVALHRPEQPDLLYLSTFSREKTTTTSP